MVGQSIVGAAEIKPLVFSSQAQIPIARNQETMGVAEVVIERVAVAELSAVVLMLVWFISSSLGDGAGCSSGVPANNGVVTLRRAAAVKARRALLFIIFGANCSCRSCIRRNELVSVYRILAITARMIKDGLWVPGFLAFDPECFRG
jgi:hypothetical protein